MTIEENVTGRRKLSSQKLKGQWLLIDTGSQIHSEKKRKEPGHLSYSEWFLRSFMKKELGWSLHKSLCVCVWGGSFCRPTKKIETAPATDSGWGGEVYTSHLAPGVLETIRHNREVSQTGTYIFSYSMCNTNRLGAIL